MKRISDDTDGINVTDESLFGSDVPNDINVRYLTITQVAKYRKIPADTLRYYDKIGLIRPNYVNKQNGRRYYSMEQCEQLGTVKELRKLNLSLKEIAEFMNDRNLQKSERILKDHFAILQEEIESKLELSRILSEKLKFIEQIRSTDFNLDYPEIRDIPTRYALHGRSNKLSTSFTAIEYTKLEEQIGGPSPILATNKVAMSLKNSIDDDEIRSEIRPLLFCTEKESEYRNFTEISGGKYICAYHANSSSYLGEIIMKMRYYAEEAGYVMGDSGLMIYQIDITLTDNSDETVVELQFPMTPAE